VVALVSVISSAQLNTLRDSEITHVGLVHRVMCLLTSQPLGQRKIQLGKKCYSCLIVNFALFQEVKTFGEFVEL